MESVISKQLATKAGQALIQKVALKAPSATQNQTEAQSVITEGITTTGVEQALQNRRPTLGFVERQSLPDEITDRGSEPAITCVTPTSFLQRLCNEG